MYRQDKGCGVVLLNKADCNEKIYDIINNSKKFEEIHTEDKSNS